MAPNLVHLIYFQNDSLTATTMDMIEMPRLISITTNFMALRHSFSTSFSLGRVVAPNLTRFALVSEGKDTSSHLGKFLEAMSSIRVMFLYGDFDPFLQPGSGPFFKQVPLLHTLTINRACRQFIDLLSSMDEGQEPLAFPVLSRLALDCNRITASTMSPHDFERLFESRCNVVEGGRTCIGAKRLDHFSFGSHDSLLPQTKAVILEKMELVKHQEQERLILFTWSGCLVA
jgi:hypothetical protein